MNDILKNTIIDLVSNFLYYDRKEDEELPCGWIESMISNGSLTVDEIVNRFRQELVAGLAL